MSTLHSPRFLHRQCEAEEIKRKMKREKLTFIAFPEGLRDERLKPKIDFVCVETKTCLQDV